MDKILSALRVAAIALALMFGSVAVQSVSAQDAVPSAVSQATDTAEDEGFDDWGLLGLLGLLGLGGLLKRPKQEVRTVERPVVDRTTTRP